MFESLELHGSDSFDYLLEDNNGSFPGDQEEDCKQRLESPRVLSCLHVFCENCLTNNLNNDTNDATKINSNACPDCKQITTTVPTTDNFERLELNAVEPQYQVEERMRCAIEKLLASAEIKVDNAIRSLSISLTELQSQLYCVREEIGNSSQSFKRILNICRDNAYREVENLHSEGDFKIMDLLQDVETSVKKIENVCKSTETVLTQSNGTELLSLKKIIGAQVVNLIKHVPQLDVDFSLDFGSNHDKFNTFGTFRTKVNVAPNSPSTLSVVWGKPNDNLLGSTMPMQSHSIATISQAMAKMGQNTENGIVPGNSLMQRGSTERNGIDKVSMLNDFMPSPAAIAPIGTNRFTFTDNVGLSMNDQINRGGHFPMQIKCKFGSLGAATEQFDSPHGFCMGVAEEIVVADTNNHRIEVFEKDGTFKFQFGVPGKEEGQLWHPRKVAVMRTNGNFVVCDRGYERSRMQIFNKDGHFIKRICIKYIDIVACLTVTNDGRIVVLDSVAPSVFFVSENGQLLHWFHCSDYVKEPSDVAISGSNFYICDFKGHSVVVFNEEGKFLHRIGHEKITCFPNGIDISDAGDLLIGDSHGNRFHIACYSRDGILRSEFICSHVKVSRCCGLKTTSEGYVVTLAKNNHHVLILKNGFSNRAIYL